MKSRLLLLSLLCVFCSYGQEKTELRIDTAYLDQKFVLPFSGVDVLDARFDQTKIGCIYPVGNANRVLLRKHDAVFPDSLSRYFPFLLSAVARFEGPAADRLLVLIKEFRIADYFHPDAQKDREPNLTLRFSASFFRCRDGRFEKLFSLSELDMLAFFDAGQKHKRNYPVTAREAVLMKLIDRMLRHRNWAVASGPAYSMEEIRLGIERRFQLPIFAGKPKPGIYASVDEWKANAPSQPVERVWFTRNRAMTGTLGGGGEVRREGVWAISDGEAVYLPLRGEWVKLVRCDRSFRVTSYRVKQEFIGRSPFDPFSAMVAEPEKGHNRIPELFDLNMDTGELYLEEVFGMYSYTRKR